MNDDNNLQSREKAVNKILEVSTHASTDGLAGRLLDE
jgi:hypothetical protein